MVYRNLGTLVNARKLKWKEAVKLMSNVKMGVDMGVIKELSDDDIAKIYFYMEPANLQKYFNQNLDGYDRDIKRGEMIRTIVKKIKTSTKEALKTLFTFQSFYTCHYIVSDKYKKTDCYDYYYGICTNNVKSE